MTLWRKLQSWYMRRFRGFVGALRISGGTGTSWQQHSADAFTFVCNGTVRADPASSLKRPISRTCGACLAFMPDDYVIRSQEHVGGCEGILDAQTGRAMNDSTRMSDLRRCACPITDARYVKICPQCGLGHWKQAKELQR